MNILVLNCGSSSLKLEVHDTGSDRRLARGLIERIGGQALATFVAGDSDPVRWVEPLRDHAAAVDRALRWLVAGGNPDTGIETLADLHAVGHRVVHGGERFREHARLDEDIIRGIEDCIEFAPLHNPANLAGIRASRALLGEALPMAAVFDTVFHATMPESSYIYPLPYQLYRRHRIRRYGFHGTSHAYLVQRYAELAGRDRESVDLVTLHLGNGCSACAVKGGRSFATSMGFTPLEGLMMGTRCGDIDPSLVEHIALREGLNLGEVDTLLNKHSGLFGVSGLTNDMRELLDEEREHDDRRARLAIELFVRRVKHYLGGYLAELGGAEAVVFSGGIGENAPEIRRRICTGLEWLGIEIDHRANEAATPGTEAGIATASSRVKLMVIPTDEERMIARESALLLAGN